MTQPAPQAAGEKREALVSVLAAEEKLYAELRDVLAHADEGLPELAEVRAAGS